MAGDINNFADEEEAGNVAGFHGFAGKFIGVHTAGGDFSFLITFRTCRSDDPFMKLMLEMLERLIGPIGRSVELEPAGGKTAGKNSLQGRTRGSEIADFAEAQG